ncbi:DUF6266 family protein [Pedobacter rhodius]|uniref:DUF6266 family protein n=1 Tax=Pedobacter rhodius TaxID=3004098 RepID=A0ABT4L3T2_9SPHI|nr:DUF6266 family protein [Pedobacter sp. SJ11]MCZ4225077.1 DUF6266 family protein [Pedobacter sp. SJ11]
MARLKNGALGGFSGKVGSVVGYCLRNKDFIKGLPKPSSKPPTLKQLASRARFKFFNEWRNPLTDFFAVSFKNQTATHSAQNAAHHYNKDIITGEYPNYEINYEKIVISSGDLPFVTDLKMEMTEPGNLIFSWEPNFTGSAKATDLLAILICYIGNNTQLAGTLNGTERGAGYYNFQLADTSPGTTVSVYATFLSNDRNRASDSVYMGKINF